MARRTRPFRNAGVAGVFRAYPPAVKARLMRLRDLIFKTASTTPGVGEIEETLKWGQPSYLTAQSGSGMTIRIDRAKGADGEVAIYVSCLTDLVETFRERYPKLRYEGKRVIHFCAENHLNEPALRHCIALALTYHLRKRNAAD